MRERVMVKDLKDQPPSRYVLVCVLGTLAVDHWYHSGAGETITFERHTRVGEQVRQERVALIPTHLTWMVYERGVLEVASATEEDETLVGLVMVGEEGPRYAERGKKDVVH